MKKNLIKNIILLTILILVVVIPMLLPKSFSKIIKTSTEPITSFEDLELEKVYANGTAIQVNNMHMEIFYYNVIGDEIGYYSYDYDSSTNEVPYVGLSDSDETENIQHWQVTEAEVYSTNNAVVSFTAVENKVNECDLDNLEIGSICIHDAKAYTYDEANIIYIDKNDNTIANRQVIYNPNVTYKIGYKSDNTSLIEYGRIWEVVEIDAGSFSSGYNNNIVMKPVEGNDELTFELKCDSNSINYNESTTCHLLVSNYILSTDPINVSLKNKDDLKITKITPQLYFNAINNNGDITVTTEYISTKPENIELFSFEVQARKQKNETKNIEINNISYYNGVEYPKPLEQTIEIRNKIDLSDNPVTSNPIVMIVIITGLVLGSSILLLKKKNV